MAGHSPSKTGVNALMPGHPRLVYNRVRKAWMPGTSPGMTVLLTLRRPAHALRQLRDEVGDCRNGARRRLAVRIEAVLYCFDQRRADRDTIRAFRNGTRLLARAHAEADRDRQGRVALDARDRILGL